ncbi:tRNA nucleotidyltransferase, mitochondrial [Termitomyces sp. J132]|nr:hypothetical protein H2248_000414 [Termitomyces sp. 'cryptogamus']KNZ78139.1 tRNA nucleotidyltransferase, mitochondrial [Termitomyces sp. J132]
MSLQHGSLGRIPIPAAMQITLTDKEAQICQLLDDCTKTLREERGIMTSCRIAGGWVRDKLLGASSNDIDITLSDMMGITFAEHLSEFALKKGIKTGSISKIAQNPDQSKHLETATFRLLGLDIDLVNLRSEEYAEDSRIPSEVTFGTPLQDALRRDTTINALFYNVHTREVEDHTGKGLEDLRNGVIRTPLPPRETFLDDPLRVLRCVRFASRFGFDIVPEIAEAAKDPVIQHALVTKVARERAGEELSKMMKGRDPLRAIQLIKDLSLYDSIFSVIPPHILATFSSPPASRDVAFTAAFITHNLLHANRTFPIPPLHPSYLSVIETDPTCRARMYLAAVLTPYKGISYPDKKKTPPAIEYIIRDVLKLGTQNHFLDGVPALFTSSAILQKPILTSERFPNVSQRVALGLLLREKVVHNPNTGSHWATSLLFSLIQELVPLYDLENDTLDVETATNVVETYNTFITKIEELDLPCTVEARPILDGREVVQALGVSKPGVWMGKTMAALLEWQLGNPGATKEMARVWLINEQQEGKIQTDDGTAEPFSKRARTK